MFKHFTFIFLLVFVTFQTFAQDEGLQTKGDTIPNDTSEVDTVFRYQKIIPTESLELEKRIELDSFDVYLARPYLTIDNKARPQNYFWSPDDNTLQLKPENFSTPFREEIGYYRTRLPVTEVTYGLGSQQYQNLDLFFSQNIDSNFNYTFNLVRHQSLGFIRNHSATRNNIMLSFNGEYSKWMIKGKFQHLRGILNESNGLTETSRLEVNPPDLVPVNKDNAQSTVDGIISEVQLYYKLNQGKKIFNMLFYRPEIDVTSRKYIETGPSVAQNGIPIDSTETKDFFQHSRMSNGVGYAHYNPLFGFESAFHFAFGKFFYLGPTVDYTQQFVTAKLFNRKKDFPIDYQADFEYHISGRNITNLKLNGFAQWEILDSLYLKGKVNFARVTPFQEDLLYISNNFNWDNDFNAINQFQMLGRLSYHLKKVSLHVELGNQVTDNLVTYDTLGAIQVGTQNVTFGGLRYGVDFNWLKNEGNVRFNLKPNDSYLRYPDFVFQNRLFFEMHLFRDNSLSVQMGAEFLYFSKMDGWAYIPELTRFAPIQNQDVGTYPFLDAFISMKFGKIRVFFKTYQLLRATQPVQSFTARNYPVNPLHFQGGISWRLLN